LHEADLTALLKRCATVLAAGELLILPTDTVYGLAARADIPNAVEAVFAAKGRDAGKSLVVMVSSAEEAAELVEPEQRESLGRLACFWPGPLTLVVRAREASWKRNVAPASGSLGIRVPGDPFLLSLLVVSGPLAVTSANPAGGRAPVSFAEIDVGVLAATGLALDDGERGSGKPSTIAEIRGSTVSVLRQGEITEDELALALMREKDGGQPPRAVLR
jgi:tRNA threonylcarbamoyl adenosine modification protein (Sua5/YciO/YrdC/YwlC family)